jgi:hypothetical protein
MSLFSYTNGFIIVSLPNQHKVHESELGAFLFNKYVQFSFFKIFLMINLISFTKLVTLVTISIYGVFYMTDQAKSILLS